MIQNQIHLNNHISADIMQLDIIKKLRERYNQMHPVMFIRSIERSKSPAELFDILDSFPNKFPIKWSEQDKKWVYTDNLPKRD